MPEPEVSHDLAGMARTLRRWIISQSLASRVGHVGSALSIVDIMAVLFGAVLRSPGSEDPARDRFILSKGHAALALYAALRYVGILEEAAFRTFCADGSLLGVHPDARLRGVDVTTGSLGQGLSVGCGLAYGLRLRGLASRVFAQLSDAECNEGQVWEAAMFAGHHGLSSVRAIVDLNGLQALGRTRDILDLRRLGRAFEAFGWEAVEVDGHDLAALLEVLAPAGDRPRVVVARTTMGRGVSFMEDCLEWHYRNLSPELAQQALRELDEA
ncbi:MAG: transketolase [Chloroflexi bacterium]|nr:MAG: transketolase [Chloroflexota bacterium]